jgi:hypothetical protein
LRNTRLEIDERLKAYLTDKDRAGCRGWLQYRIQRKYRREDFERLFNEIGGIDMSLIWDDAEDPSLPPINENKEEWTEDYFQDVLNALKFNFSNARFIHAIEVACALEPEQDLGNDRNDQSFKLTNYGINSSFINQGSAYIGDALSRGAETTRGFLKKKVNELLLDDIRDAKRYW